MSIRNKISLLVAACMLLFGCIIFWVLIQNIRTQVKADVLSNFQEQQKTIVQYQGLIYDRLVESALLVGENPAFKANVSLNDAMSVAQIVEEFLDMLKVDLITVTDANGTLLSSYPEGIQSHDFQTRDGIDRALLGEIPDIEFDYSIIWHIEPDIYQVVSVPISTDYEILGTLTLGAMITDYEAQDLQLSDKSDIHILNDGHIHASSDKDESAKEEIESYAKKELGKDSIGLIESSNYFISMSQLDENATTYLINTTEKSIALGLISKLFKVLAWLALGALIITICSGGILGQIISAPMKPIIGAFNSVEGGDLSTRLNEDRSDEFGRLSQAFNKMVIGLEEGNHLRKYVGHHTLEKVTEGINESQKVDAAVMFSDIRGFTNYAQNRSPVAVVAMLNEWLGFQTQIIINNGGSVDKFVGDEVMALFQGSDALNRCVTCAIQIQERASNFDKKTELGLGIGINYGPMILGDIGIDQRKDYTVIGAVVNMAARLCDLAKQDHIAIPSKLISNSDITYDTESVSLKGIDKEQTIAFIKP